MTTHQQAAGPGIRQGTRPGIGLGTGPAAERHDAVEAPLAAGLAALAQMRRRGRPCGQVAVEGDRLLLRLAPGSAGDVPELLRWLGWGHLDGVLRTRPMPAVPRQTRCGAPEGAHDATQDAASGALTERHLPQALDTLADACARALMERSGTAG
ncbi:MULTISPECIES: hypothetical protein [Streptacidiphilus]|uniref:Uncharacterized protein n=1 Tax=Streptacidiphilus cavernicola TaxID=3342716 RepID=A0ABV6USN6_9ACTN|nr:hypothetical protein [Streptacidiphilus jeojiense]